MEYRQLRADEADLLDGFLYLAIYQDAEAEPLPRSITAEPELARYVQAWGRPGDFGVLAVDGNDPVGLAWARLFLAEEPGYGTVDADTPELSIAVVPEARGRGVGTRLMRELLKQLAAHGWRQASLSVQSANPAVGLYQRLGFTTIRDHEGDFVMVVAL